jgi:predicted nucleic acid-binding protein
VRECLQEYIACKQEKLSAWELGKDLFGRHSSGRGDLSLRRKEILKEKVRAAKGVIDSGPLVALFDRGDQYHKRACAFLKDSKGELLSTVAVLTEVSHLLDFSVPAQIDFVRWIATGAVELVHLSREDLARIVELTQQYSDLPMDFADASLVVIGERLSIEHIATIDADSYVCRMKGRRFFHNIFR